MNFRTLVASAAVAVVASQAAAEYPEKPIEMVIPFGPGSNTDTIGRLFLNAMSKALDGATMVPRNVAGAGGTIGTAELAAAAGDGYTIGLNPIATVTIQPHLRPLPYGQDSVVPICRLSDTPLGVMVAKDSPFNSVDELIAGAKAGNVVSVGPAPGSVPHIAQAALAAANGVQFTYLPAGGSAKAGKALAGGEASVTMQIVPNADTLDLRLLAVMANERFAATPDIPTVKELGTDIALSVWFGVFAPQGTPEDVVNTLSQACAAAVQDQALNDGLAASGIQISYLDRADFTTFYNDQFNDNKAMLKLIGLGE